MGSQKEREDLEAQRRFREEKRARIAESFQRLRRLEVSKREIARQLGLHRHTVRDVVREASGGKRGK